MILSKRKYCPKCHSQMKIKRFGFIEHLLGGCAFEIIFWIVLGIVASIVALTNIVIVIVLFLFSVIVMFLLSYFFVYYYCKECEIEYKKKKNKLIKVKETKY